MRRSGQGDKVLLNLTGPTRRDLRPRLIIPKYWKVPARTLMFPLYKFLQRQSISMCSCSSRSWIQIHAGFGKLISSPSPSTISSRFISTTNFLNARTHYQTLGISNVSTQADIKNAYYRLSMQHHPDKKKGSNEKFREITIAYEVLGNPRLRRLYDRGIISDEELDASIHNDNHVSYPTEEQSERIKQTVRSFDQYSKLQTSRAFYRTQEAKREMDNKKYATSFKSADRGAESLVWFVCLVIFVFISAGVGGMKISTWNKKDKDAVTPEPKKKS